MHRPDDLHSISEALKIAGENLFIAVTSLGVLCCVFVCACAYKHTYNKQKHLNGEILHKTKPFVSSWKNNRQIQVKVFNKTYGVKISHKNAGTTGNILY